MSDGEIGEIQPISTKDAQPTIATRCGIAAVPRSANAYRPYHRSVIPPFVIGLVLIVGIVALAPARRLYLAGRSTGFIATWLAALWLFGIIVGLAPGLARFLVPLLLALYIAPFFTWPLAIERVLGRRRPDRRPMKNVTPQPQDEPSPPR